MKFINPDMSKMPEGAERKPNHVVIEDHFVEPWLEDLDDHGFEIKVEDCDCFDYDCGGIVSLKEPTLSYKMPDFRLGLLTRHVDYLHEAITRVQTHLDNLGPHVWLRGYWVSAVFTVERAKEIESWLDEIMPAAIAESDQWWAHHRETMANHNVLVPPRRLP